MSVITVRRLKKYFDSTRAVDGVSFDIKKGEIVGFLGPNGAGKSTTIKCMMGFLRPDFGEINILGFDVRSDSKEVKKHIGYLAAETELYGGWTGKEHIDLVNSMRSSASENTAVQLIKKLDFDPRKKIKTLSTGNKQKLGLILAMMHNPAVLVLDEPTAGLDPILQLTIHSLLQEAAGRGTTIFMSSHNLAEVERLCHRALIIKEGKIVGDENIPNQVKNVETPRTKLEAAFLKLYK